MSSELRRALDWGKLAPLELRARTVADGIYAGSHRSPRRGAGVEFGGHRAYVPGDDLRWLDRHALMRHGRLLVREFETETDRALRLVIDGSASMAYRSPNAPAAKLAFAAVLAAALTRIAVAGGDLRVDNASIERALAPVARRAGRGSVIVFFSDLIDLPSSTLDRFAALASRNRIVIAVRVLDPLEAEFPFEGALRLRSSEGDVRVETDGGAARAGYLAALEEIAKTWHDRLVQRGGRLIRARTADDAIAVVREILVAAEGAGA